jgi:DsbC/DsbD-like thiol-disulfide interchange protein
MQKLLFLALTLFTLSGVHAQQNGSAEAVNWNVTTKKLSANQYQVTYTATIKTGWHMYAQEGGAGPVYTSFTFTSSPLFTIPAGLLKEQGKKITVLEKAFGTKVAYYENTVSFVQVINAKAAGAKFPVEGKVEFMTCNDHECLPPATVSLKANLGS